MIPVLKKHGQVLFAIVGALAVIGTALWESGNEDRLNAWLYVFCVWLIIYSAIEAFSGRQKNKKK